MLRPYLIKPTHRPICFHPWTHPIQNPAVLNMSSVQRFLEEQSQFQSQMADKAATLLTPERLEIYKQNQATVRQMATMQLTSIVQLSGGGQ